MQHIQLCRNFERISLDPIPDLHDEGKARTLLPVQVDFGAIKDDIDNHFATTEVKIISVQNDFKKRIDAIDRRLGLMGVDEAY